MDFTQKKPEWSLLCCTSFNRKSTNTQVTPDIPHLKTICTFGSSLLTNTKPYSLKVFGDHAWPSFISSGKTGNTAKYMEMRHPASQAISKGTLAEDERAAQRALNTSWFLAWGIPVPVLTAVIQELLRWHFLLQQFIMSLQNHEKALFTLKNLSLEQACLWLQNRNFFSGTCFSSHCPWMGLRCWWHSTLFSRGGEAIIANYCSPQGVWPDFDPLFLSKANSSSLFPRLLPSCSVTGYKWKQQGHSKLYFQSSLEVIQTEMLNRPCICHSKAGKIKLPFVFTTAAEEPLSHSQQPIYGPSEVAKRTHSFALPGFTQQIFQGMCPIPLHYLWGPRSVGLG